MKVTIEISSCEDCTCLDDGDAGKSEFYCDHSDAPRGSDGKNICFDIEDGIPEWCPLRKMDTGSVAQR